MVMPEKKLDEDGFEMIDGRPVEIYEGRFTNTFEMEFEEGSVLSDGGFVTMLITAEIGTPKFNSNKQGQLKRANQMKVIDARSLSQDEAIHILDSMGQLPNAVNPSLATVSNINDKLFSFDEEG